ncbi:MAG: M23 family metallopeptidase [Rikenellaceae bacterium]|jgi:hypothetical protein|nr:M23 family metallopeptidase [Rikenellaceae bacterium]
MRRPGRKNSHLDKPKHPVHLKRKLIRLGIGSLVWLGIAVVYYLIFSFFFDTPIEYGMKQSLIALEREYDQLNDRYEMLEKVLDNVSERDRQIFRTLYDSEPLNYDEGDRSMLRMDSLMSLTNQQLAATFFDRFDRFEEQTEDLRADLDLLLRRVEERGIEMNRIPSIQPVIDPDLTQIATSYGMRIHPFYRTMVMHNGMDYAVPEGTRVFATADGTVTLAASNQATTGTTLEIDHGNGYKTSYHHLSRLTVRRGNQVRRGDIVALTGNTGLSLAPHLHYGITLDDQPVDPIHYFFYELGPVAYEEVERQAAVGMQSFD